MRFSEAYAEFISYHLRSRSGERLRRLKEGHSHAELLFLENVWWPSFGHFEHLHPEFEVHDFREGIRYLDFAYIRPGFRVCFEIDGFVSHAQKISRWKFSDNLIRQNHLVIDGWKVIRFSYDDVEDKPRRCQQVIQQLMGRWLGEQKCETDLTYIDKEIIRLAVRKGNPITPLDVSTDLAVSDKHARKLLRNLVGKKVLTPASGTKRIRSYRLNLEGRSIF